jgi:hypothetical protein
VAQAPAKKKPAGRRMSFFSKNTEVVTAESNEHARFKELLSAHLYDAWYREALLLLASSAGDRSFANLIDFLLTDNSSGVNDHLVNVMLEERREHPLYSTKKALLQKQQEQRLLDSVVVALSHPNIELRESAVEQMQRLGLDTSHIVDRIVSELSGSITDKEWYSCTGLVESLISIRKASGSDESSDTTLAMTIVNTLLDHPDSAVGKAAVHVLGELGIHSEQVVYGLLGKLEQGAQEVLVDIFSVLQSMSVPTAEIIQQMNSRTRIPSDDPNMEWLAVASALGQVTVTSAEDRASVLEALDPVLNHADASVSAAGAAAMARLGASERVVDFCKEFLPEENPLQDRLACIKALRAAGEAQLQVAETEKADAGYMMQRQHVFGSLLEIAADENPAMRMTAESSLVAISADDDACRAAVAKMEQMALATATAAEPERLSQAAATIARMKCTCDTKLLVAKLAETLVS